MGVLGTVCGQTGAVDGIWSGVLNSPSLSRKEVDGIWSGIIFWSSPENFHDPDSLLNTGVFRPRRSLGAFRLSNPVSSFFK